jgi:hypothetical protein
MIELLASIVISQAPLDQRYYLDLQQQRNKVKYCRSMDLQINFYPSYKVSGDSLYDYKGVVGHPSPDSIEDCKFARVGSLNTEYTITNEKFGFVMKELWKLEDDRSPSVPEPFRNTKNLLLCRYSQFIPFPGQNSVRSQEYRKVCFSRMARCRGANYENGVRTSELKYSDWTYDGCRPVPISSEK